MNDGEPSKLKPDLSQPHSDTRWLVERYVLGDPTLDRSAFEEAMSEDVRLALAVSDCVERLQCVSLAAGGLGGECVPSRTRAVLQAATERTTTWKRIGRIAVGLAAALAVVVGVWSSTSRLSRLTAINQSTTPDGRQQQLTEVARQWLAMDQVLTEDGLLPGQTSGVADGEPLPELVWIEAEPFELGAQAHVSVTDENDWMLQVAASFFNEVDG